MSLFFKLILLVFLQSIVVANDTTEPVVKMGYLIDGLRHIQYKDSRIALDMLIEGIAEHDNLEISVLYFKRDPEIVEGYLKNDFSTLTINGYFYLKNMEEMDKVNKKCWLVKENYEDYEQYVLLTRNPNIKTLKDLEGKKIAIAEDNYLAQVFLKREMIVSLGKDSKKLSYKLIKMRKNSTAILRTFFGKVDASLVPVYTLKLVEELNPVVGTTLKRLITSPKVFAPVISFSHKDGNEKYMNIYANHVKRLATTPRGQNILDLFRIKEVKEIECKEFTPMKEYFKMYESLKSSIE